MFVNSIQVTTISNATHSGVPSAGPNGIFGLLALRSETLSLSASKANDSSVVHLSGNETISGTKIFNGNVVVNGDFVVNGTNTVVNTIEISAKDNQIVINAGEVGAGVTAGIAGFRVDRGTLQDYDFQFRESDDSFVIGISGQYQPVATREDIPVDDGIAIWDASTSKFITSTTITSAGYLSLQTNLLSISGFSTSNVNAITGSLILKANDSTVVHTTGNETVAGIKTFTSSINTSGNLSTSNDVITRNIQLGTTFIPTYSEGKLFYDPIERTPAYFNDINGITVNLGQEHLIRVRNNNSFGLSNGQVVYVNGASGNEVTVTLAKSDTTFNSRQTIGVMTQNLSANSNGYATRLGKVKGINTNSFNEGDAVYLSSSISGGLQNTKPVAPNKVVRIGFITKKSLGDGHLLVDIDSGTAMTEVNDVSLTSISGGDVLSYNIVTGVWENKAVSTLNLGIQNSNGIRKVFSNYSTTNTDYTVLVSTSGGPVTVSLSVSATNGQILNVKKVTNDLNTVTINGVIDNSSNDIFNVKSNFTYQYFSNDNSWYKI